MSAVQAFSGAPTRDDWLMLAQLAYAAVANNGTSVGPYLAAYKPNPTVKRPAGTAGGNVRLITWDSGEQWLFFADSSYKDPTLWAQILGGTLIPGQTGNVLPNISKPGALKAGAVAGLLDKSQPVVILGHALGGALAIYAGAFLQDLGFQVSGIYVMGAPAIGDVAYMQPITGKVYRLENSGDPVVALLPEAALTIDGLSPPWDALASLQAGTAGGSITTLTASGVLQPGAAQLPPMQAVLAMAGGEWTSNTAGEYLRRLKAQPSFVESQVAGADGYASPWVLWDQNPPTAGGGFNAVGLGFGKLETQSQATQGCQEVCNPRPLLRGTIAVPGSL